jgi:hypothetical protein
MILDGLTESVDVADAALDNFFVGGGTMMCWIFPFGFGGNGFGRLFDKASTTGATLGWAMQLTDSNDAVRFEYAFDTSEGAWETPINSIVLNNAYHVALAYDDGDVANNPSIYLNGVLQTLTEATTPVGTAESDAAETLGIGNIVAASYVRGFDGWMGEHRFYNRILSAVEIGNIVNTQVPYPYDQILNMPWLGGAVGVTPSGADAVKDQSPSKADGTVNGTPVWATSTFGALRRRAS